MSIEDTAEGIRSMRIRGAARIAIAASQALVDETRAFDGEGPDSLEEHIRASARILLGTRPTAVSLKNAIRATLRPVFQPLDGRWTLDGLKEAVIKAGEEFIKNAKAALEAIADYGSKRMKRDSVVMTHCNSNAALSVIEKAFEKGSVKMVYATESRPWRQGHLTVKRLADKGIPVTLIVDSAVRHFINDMDAVVVGADTIASNGAVINKIGTSQIALCANEARVPVVVAAETFKFSPGTLEGELVEIEERDKGEVVDPADFPGVDIANPVFDATPPEYIDVIVTERGIISPHAAYQFAQEFGTDLP